MMAGANVPDYGNTEQGLKLGIYFNVKVIYSLTEPFSAAATRMRKLVRRLATEATEWLRVESVAAADTLMLK